MSKSIKWIIAVVLLVVLVAGASILYNQLVDNYSTDRLATQDMQQFGDSTSESQSVPENDSIGNYDEQQKYKAPDFTVIDSSGAQINLSDMVGKPIVLNFWASWCPPCKNEMPDFEKMYKQLGSDINFMMINSTDGYQETLEQAKAYVEEKGYTFPVYYDTNQQAVYSYQITSFPTTFFIDADGNLVTYAVGMIDYETLKKGIEMIK